MRCNQNKCYPTSYTASSRAARTSQGSSLSLSFYSHQNLAYATYTITTERSVCVFSVGTIRVDDYIKTQETLLFSASIGQSWHNILLV